MTKARTDIKARVARAIVKRRKRLGMTQSQLARELGLERQRVYDIEQGTCNLTLDSLEWMSSGLQCTASHLVK